MSSVWLQGSFRTDLLKNSQKTESSLTNHHWSCNRSELQLYRQCPEQWKNDGYCDDLCAQDICGNDGGDCDGNQCDSTSCSVYKDLWFNSVASCESCEYTDAMSIDAMCSEVYPLYEEIFPFRDGYQCENGSAMFDINLDGFVNFRYFISSILIETVLSVYEMWMYLWMTQGMDPFAILSVGHALHWPTDWPVLSCRWYHLVTL